jgi:Na+/citrate or Na+/malate symporter
MESSGDGQTRLLVKRELLVRQMRYIIPVNITVILIILMGVIMGVIVKIPIQENTLQMKQGQKQV